MNENSTVGHITQTFPDIKVVNAEGNYFFFCDPDRRMPFVTLVTRDEYDTVSDLNRPSVFRLNIGVSKATYLSLFDVPAPRPGRSGVVETGHDFTALDQLMPHPVYATMFWVCILNPAKPTSETIEPLLEEAHGLAIKRLAAH